MKKLLFGLIAIVVFGVSGKAQTNIGSEELKFYLENQFEFLKNCNSTSELRKIFADSKVDESELKLFYVAFSTTEKDFLNYLIKQNNLINSIEEKLKLSKLSKSELTTIFDREIELIYSQESTNNKTAPDCKRRFLNQIVANSAAAYVGHLTCISLDVTVFAGIACHAAVGIAQYVANDNAHLDYLSCIGAR